MITLATHNGTFHADDVLAYTILDTVFPENTLIRTRDVDRLASIDILFDVYGEYDHSLRHYDHHQVGGAGHRVNGVPYSSAGLIWMHYGHQYLRAAGYDVFINELWVEIDEALIQGIDAVDNGKLESISKLKGTELNVQVQTLSGVVSEFNTNWYDENLDLDNCFLSAAEFVGQILRNVAYSCYGKLLAAQSVRESQLMAEDIFVLDRFMPWQEVVCTELPHVKFVVFPDVSGSWRVQVVPKELGKLDAHKDLPAEWAGLCGRDLRQSTGVSDAIFCHNNRFIAGAETREGALALAKLASKL